MQSRGRRQIGDAIAGENRGLVTKGRPCLPIRFQLDHAGAHRVALVGSFNRWKKNATMMRDMGGGHWVAQVSLPPGRHEYFFIADGVRIPDPAACRYEYNPTVGLNSVLHV